MSDVVALLVVALEAASHATLSTSAVATAPSIDTGDADLPERPMHSGDASERSSTPRVVAGVHHETPDVPVTRLSCDGASACARCRVDAHAQAHVLQCLHILRRYVLYCTTVATSFWSGASAFSLVTCYATALCDAQRC
jgi:hypothetical protein